ncbi:MAG: clan AA aspartic protease [Chloroflexota bacterium]|nr:clan AA aspartic protease [Chloroflexota bacterium]
MRGYVDEYGQPRAEISATGVRESITVDAIIDTGFNGELCLPTQIAVQLGLELSATQMAELADGTMQRELIFIGRGVFDGRERRIEISLTGGQDALLGTGLLENKALEIDFPKRTVEIR